MSRLASKKANTERRTNRVRKTVTTNDKRPRLSVTISNLHISAQIIDDTKGVTIVSATTVNNKAINGTMTDKAKLVGEDIAKKAKSKKISTVAFDRGGKLYHGRIKALAEAARKEGLKF